MHSSDFVRADGIAEKANIGESVPKSISHVFGLGVRIMAARAHVTRIMRCSAAGVDAPARDAARRQPGEALKNLEPSSRTSTSLSVRATTTLPSPVILFF